MKSVFITKPWVGAAGLALVCACGPGRARTALGSADGGGAQRLVALVDYIGGDYKRAVEGGRVVSDAEYEEQVRFAADALGIAVDLLGKEAQAGDALLALLREVQAHVEAKADPAVVAAACRAAR